MELSVRFCLERATPLTPSEFRAVAQHIRRTQGSSQLYSTYDPWIAQQARDDETVVMGSLSVYYDNPDDPDVQALLRALTELRQLLSTSRMMVWDSYELIAWDAGRSTYDLLGYADTTRFQLPSPAGTMVRLDDIPSENLDAPLVSGTATSPAPPPPPTNRPHVDESALSLHLAGDLEVTVVTEVLGPALKARGWVRNPHPVPANLTEVAIVVRDRSGRAIGVDERMDTHRIDDAHRIDLSFDVAPAVVDSARSVDLLATYELAFREQLGAWDISLGDPVMIGTPDLPKTQPFPVHTALGVTLGRDYTAHVTFVVELSRPLVCQDFYGELGLILADDNGNTLASSTTSLFLDRTGAPLVTAIRVDAPEEVLRTATRAMVELSGSATRRLTLASAALT